MAGLHCHDTIKTKNRSHSINEVKKLGYEIRRQNFVLCSTQIYRALYSMARHVGAHPDGHQHDSHRSEMLLQ